MEDFLGLVDVKAQDWMPTLENVETVGIFARLFRMEYQGMNPSDADINLFLQGVLASGEFDHKAYHPVRDFLSAVADVTIILPLIESIIGYDFITKEGLTDLECGLKAAGAIADLLTFGNGAILMNATEKGVKEFAVAVAKTMAVDALASGASYLTGQMLEDMGMPAGLSTIMTAIVSGTVTYSAGKYFFKNEAGEILRECTGDELEKLMKGEATDVADDVIKSGGGTFFGNYSTKIDTKVTVVNKQELPTSLAKTFKDGNYRTVVTNEDIIVYRSFGYNAEAGGAFATSSPALNRVQTKVDCAILPEWKNTLRYEAEIVIPEGTILNIGRVEEQFTMSGARLAGDADQILLPQNWDLNWIQSIREVKP